MYTPQAGIFALGTSSHTYLEFDILDAKKRNQFASTISAIREPRTTTGGVNFVIGFRPELWREIAPDDTPSGLEGFNKAVQGTEGFVMPATQHDAVVWLSGSAYDVIFDMARSIIHDLAGQASLAEETSSWSYRHDRDLTGRLSLRPRTNLPVRCEIDRTQQRLRDEVPAIEQGIGLRKPDDDLRLAGLEQLAGALQARHHGLSFQLLQSLV